MEWNYLVIGISAILGLSLVLLEVRRKPRRNLLWRLIASVLAVGAVTLIALPPTYTKKNHGSGDRDVVLLTAGYSKDSLSAFSNPVIIATDKKLLAGSGAGDRRYIPSLDYYLSENPAVRSLHILGTGLPEEELAMLKSTGVQFHGPEKPFGFQQVKWQPSVRSGDELIVAGTFNNSLNGSIKIRLKGLGTILDSATVSADSMGNFILGCTPRQLGKAINHLIVTSGEDTLSVEKVPFEVEPIEPLNILVLSSAPDFEMNFLKQWLAENKFRVAQRSRISNGKFSTEFVNMDPFSLNLQSAMLKSFDVLITDETAISQLSQAERSALKKEITNGLGLVVRDEEDVKLPELFGVSFRVTPTAAQEEISVRSPGSEVRTILPGGGLNYLAPAAYDQPLILDNKDRVLVTSIHYGQGRVAFSTINNTYSLKLSGKSAEYSGFWSSLIEKTARKKQASHVIAIADQFPVIHEKVRVRLQANSTASPELLADNAAVSLKQDAALPNQWSGVVWPVRTGWNNLKIAEHGKSFFVFGPDDWLSARNSLYTRATRQFAQQSVKQRLNNSNFQDFTKEKIPSIYFYLVLLACCAYLWIETKFL